jgi:hypothetical protein
VTNSLPGYLVSSIVIRHDSTIFDGDGMIVDARRLENQIAARLAIRRDNASLPSSRAQVQA